MFSDLSQSPLSKNLQRLFLLRNISVAAQALTFALAYWVLEMQLPWAEMVSVTAMLAAAQPGDLGAATPQVASLQR